MSKRDELAAVLGYAEQEHAENYLPEHGADAVLAWLGEQFDEGLRNDVGDELAPYLYSPWNSRRPAVDAIAVVRSRLGLSDAAQDAQDGAETASEVGSGSGCHSDAARPGEVQPCDSEGER